VTWAVYMVVPSQTSPTNSWVMVPVAVSLAIHPTLSPRRLEQGSYAAVRLARGHAPRRIFPSDQSRTSAKRSRHGDGAGRPAVSLQRICFERDVASFSHLA
jgi:hypothetical protein